MEARKRILVVDDEPRIGNVLRIKLRLAGFDAITTTSGFDAIELVRTKEVDIILLDLLMPDVPGKEVIERIRAFSQVPIIVFSGRPEIAKLARKYGASDYISKPFNPDFLIEKINSCLATSKTTKGNYESKNENSSR
jgi:two-component system KDP operon response regulator KdpE